jgi:hypothetical protein
LHTTAQVHTSLPILDALAVLLYDRQHARDATLRVVKVAATVQIHSPHEGLHNICEGLPKEERAVTGWAKAV